MSESENTSETYVSVRDVTVPISDVCAAVRVPLLPIVTMEEDLWAMKIASPWSPFATPRQNRQAQRSSASHILSLNQRMDTFRSQLSWSASSFQR